MVCIREPTERGWQHIPVFSTRVDLEIQGRFLGWIKRHMHPLSIYCGYPLICVLVYVTCAHGWGGGKEVDRNSTFGGWSGGRSSLRRRPLTRIHSDPQTTVCIRARSDDRIARQNTKFLTERQRSYSIRAGNTSQMMTE